MKKKKITLLEKTINKGRQDLSYVEVSKIGDFKVKINIKSDSYREQCFARISVWCADKLTWNIVSSIHPSRMITPSQLAYCEAVSEKDFILDRDALVESIIKILF